MRKEIYVRVVAALFFVVFFAMGYVLYFFSLDGNRVWLAAGFWLASFVMAFAVMLGP